MRFVPESIYFAPYIFCAPVVNTHCAYHTNPNLFSFQDHCIRVLKADGSEVAFQVPTDAPVGAFCAFSRSGEGTDQVSATRAKHLRNYSRDSPYSRNPRNDLEDESVIITGEYS